MRLKYGSASVVVPVSQAIADILWQQGLPQDRMRTVPDCIPLGENEAQWAGLTSPIEAPTELQSNQLRERLGRRWGVSPYAVWIGNIAALVPHKDQATLLKAFKIVASKMPNARLFIIGGGPLKPQLEALARELQITDIVRFTGHQPSQFDWLGALDLFVLSSWGEGMGSVLLEALAYRRPIVATTAGGIPEIIEDERNGVLVPPRNPKELAQSILRALQRKDITDQWIHEGAHTLESFRLSRCGEQMEECYDLAIGSKAVKNGH
jgi:glycosyltransferase involved in cell wall biosynthesis